MSSATNSDRDRADRFVHCNYNGVCMYEKESIENMVKQFDESRCKSYEDMLQELEKDLSNDSFFKAYWDFAKSRFDENPEKCKKHLKVNGGGTFPDECHIALICYTLDDRLLDKKIDVLYGKYNNECRKLCAGDVKFDEMKYKSLFYLLRHVMENKEQDVLPQKFYRGCYESYEPAEFQVLKGFGQFTTVTSSYSVSLRSAFACPTKCKTIFEIQDAVRPQQFPTKSIIMKPYSVSDDEEYLLSPFQLYRLIRHERIETLDIDMVYLEIY